MKGVVTIATGEPNHKIVLKNVFAYTQKKMHYLKQEGKELGGIASFIVTRTLLHVPFFSLFVTLHLQLPMPQMHDQDNSDWSKDSRIQSNLQSVSDAFFSHYY